MKTYKLFLFLSVLSLALASCDHTDSMETVVHENGELEKTVVVSKKNGSYPMLGMGERTGWTEKIIQNEKDETITIYQKTFSSQEEANAELASPSDTLFRVTSTFEKKFRWFYTYIYYADTYQALNRMKLPPDNYIALEDYAFIERLPMEGKEISEADSLYLEKLTEKIFDIYGTRAIYEEMYDLGVQTIREKNLDNQWIDTLNKHKESIYAMLTHTDDPAADAYQEDDFIFSAMERRGIPLPYAELKKNYREISKQLDAKMDFISFAYNGKYHHKIEMPWNVTSTNADSISGNQLFWSPPSVKFLLKDYTMYAETRRLNYWAVGVLIIILGFTGYLFLRKRL
jgi:hypothetical protein